MATGGSKLVIFASIAANLLIALLKFIASVFTGSAAMLSEGIHSIIDTVNGFLLLLGVRRSKIAPSKQHPFGHGMEVYFWSFIVAILVFALGGGVAIYEGVKRIIEGSEHTGEIQIWWNYGVLLGSILFEGLSLLIAWKAFRKTHPNGFASALRESKDATSIAIIVENAAAVAGLLIALVGVTLSHFLHNPIYDSIASIVIGLLLTYVAFFMAAEVKHLLIGETASSDDIQLIRDIVDDYKEIDTFGNIKTMHLSPEEVMVAMEVNFNDDIPVTKLESIIHDLKSRMREKAPRFKHIYIESNSKRQYDFDDKV